MTWVPAVMSVISVNILLLLLPQMPLQAGVLVACWYLNKAIYCTCLHIAFAGQDGVH